MTKLITLLQLTTTRKEQAQVEAWKVLRSYHTPVAVKKITLVPYDTEVERPTETSVYIYNQSDIDSVRKTMIDNSLQDVVTKTNTITFKTNFTKKFVVATIPYDPGWAVDTVDGVADSLQSSRRFVGFLSEAGPTIIL